MRLVVVTLLMACLCWGAQDPKCPPPPSHMAMAKGEYSARPGVVFALENFSATMVPRSKKPPLCYVKTTDIEHGHVVVSTESLTTLFLDKMENSPGNASAKAGGSGKDPQGQSGKDAKNNSNQKISDIKIKTSGQDIVITGKVHKLIALPFEIKGPLDVVNGRLLRVHVDKIKAAGLEVKGLLDMLGVHLTKMLNPEAANGVTVQENAILFNPEALAHVRGQIAKAQVEGNDLVVDFVAPVRTARAKPHNHR